jgi:alpha-2-macroglobulin
MIRVLLAILVVILAPLPLAAQDTPGPMPERRLVILPDVDFYGGDLQAIYNATYAGCQRACLIDPRCGAFTFNTRSNACFPKAGSDDPRPFAGALSGRVIDTAPEVLARATTRGADLGFLSPGDLVQARAQAEAMADRHVAGAVTEGELQARAAAARAAGDVAGAVSALGAALNLTDAAQDWLDYARLVDGQPASDGFQRRENRAQALSAAVNAYLRAETPLLRADAMVAMADMLEPDGRGRQALSALRLAQEILPRDALAGRLEAAIERHGFRIVETRVESDLARPRICADFSEQLAAGVDFAPFVQIAAPGLAVEAEGSALCLSGVEHGQSYGATFRPGLPAADGQTLSRSVTLDFYVRDRAPAVRFPGRAYVLPRGADMALPVQTVNTDRLNLALRRISDRNLVQSIRNDWFGRALDTWQDEEFARNVAEEIWTGTAEVARELNRDVTTRLPLGQAAGPLEPGLYVLKASVPGQNPWDATPAMQWFVVSDLGMTALSGIDGLHVFVRALGSAEAKAGVTLQLVSRSNRVLGEAVTDAAGYAVFPPGLSRGTGGAEAGAGGGRGWGRRHGLPVADRPRVRPVRPRRGGARTRAAGRRVPDHRPRRLSRGRDGACHRAGPRRAARAIEGLPLTARLIRPDGMEYSRSCRPTARRAAMSLPCPIDARAPRGTWRLEVLADPDAAAAGQHRPAGRGFPARADRLRPDACPMGRSPGRRAQLTIEARYLFGAPGADLAIEGEVILRAATDC